MLRKNYWREQQNLYLNIFAESLLTLQRSYKSTDHQTEDSISRELYLIIAKVVFSVKYKKQELGLPNFQSQAQPNLKDKVKIKREDKRPDFLWSYVDYINRTRRDFYVECKRLREDKASHCREYVVSGIARFIEKEWSYGIGCENGLMVGYVESLTLDECVLKIGEYLAEKNISQITKFPNGMDTKHIVHLNHTLSRNGIAPNKMKLFHYLVTIKTN